LIRSKVTSSGFGGGVAADAASEAVGAGDGVGASRLGEAVGDTGSDAATDGWLDAAGEAVGKGEIEALAQAAHSAAIERNATVRRWNVMFRLPEAHTTSGGDRQHSRRASQGTGETPSMSSCGEGCLHVVGAAAAAATSAV
jgi:hypothetical protein